MAIGQRKSVNHDLQNRGGFKAFALKWVQVSARLQIGVRYCSRLLSRS